MAVICATNYIGEIYFKGGYKVEEKAKSNSVIIEDNKGSKNHRKMKIIKLDNLYTFLGLIALCFVLSILSPVFFTYSNITNIFLQASVNGLLAIGLTFVIITSGIDLSVGSILALSGIAMGNAMTSGMPLIAALLIGIGVGFLCGLFNGFIITRFNMPPFIVTLGMMSVARGLALYWTNGGQIYGFTKEFRWIGSGEVLTIPVPVIIMLIVAVIAAFILKYTRLGRYTYAIGGNHEATRLSGVNTDKYLRNIYGISGFMAGLAGVVLAARLNSAQPIAGMGYELEAIAATVIGGTSLSGGVGTIFGTIVGALIIGVIRNGLNLLNVSSFLQQVVIGSVIILAVLIDSIKKKNR